MSMESIRWTGQALLLLDQRRLPHTTAWLTLTDAPAVAQAITAMAVRGAPAIAIAAAYGLVLAVRAGQDRRQASALLQRARPTAVNLRWALERLAQVPDDALEAEAIAIHQEDLAANRALGDHGAALLTGGVLTICNTGALATAGWGTALGMIRSAHRDGHPIHVYAMETRPRLQGARLTAHECIEEGIPCTLITDSMAGALLASGRVQQAVAGCDRVAANGDTANKIGTYALAVLCSYHNVPLYIAMPTTTLDRRCPDGSAIPIEQRSPDEVTVLAGVSIAPSGVEVWNPAFDVTPAALIAGWVTEHGLWTPPFPEPVDAGHGGQ